MSKAVNSPTARLLQSSRLFSLPRPLPAPDLSNAVSGVFRSSETATTPYPTHQAIVTPASSLHRGDWGLKRSLPGKKLRGTKPTVRVRAQDTWEHVTTFESAGDHVRTLEKWNEMGIPMIINEKDDRGRGPGASFARRKPISVYDDAHDITDKDATEELSGEGRWKYEGPWLSGMQKGEFENWLLRQVSSRRSEWKEFLRQRENEKRIKSAWAEARAEGNALTPEDIERLRATDQDLQGIQKQLRDEHANEQLNSELTRLITTFLDLPMASLEGSQNLDSAFLASIMQTMSAEKGPPSTHPGAGLSHLRTHAIMDNHPIHGPQSSRTPIQARVVKPRVGASGGQSDYRAKLGVGGVVAEDSTSATLAEQDMSRFRKDTSDATHVINPRVPGGGKVWVRPQAAWVDEQGRIRMNLRRADEESVAVKTGDVEAIHEQKRQGNIGPPRRTMMGQTANYGTALPDTKRMSPTQRAQVAGGAGSGQTPRSGAKGFDEELAGAGPGGVADLLRRGW